MNFRRITISVPEEVAAKAARAVEAGHVESVSAYFADLASREPDWAEAQAALDEMSAIHGPVSDADVAWAEAVLGITERADFREEKGVAEVKAVVLDAGALIALERGDRQMRAVAQKLVASKTSAHVPAGVVAQVWRGSPRQHGFVRLMRAESLRVHALTEDVAYRIGLLLASTGTADVVDAHVAILARSLGAVVLTSDADDLRRIDAALELVVV